MRIYLNPTEMVKEVERDLFEMGIKYQSKTVQDKNVADDPDFQTLELFGYAYKLKNVEATSFYDAVYYQRGQDPDYVEWMIAEGKERTNPFVGNLNPGLAWRIREDFWQGYIRDGIFSYTYSSRFIKQIPLVINELMSRPDTRQAIITMYDRHEDMLNWGGHDRVPCSVSYQFIARDEKLNVIYNQRSCDFVNFFLADVYFTVVLLEYIAKMTGFIVGDFTHFLGSLHTFRGDLKGKDIF